MNLEVNIEVRGQFQRVLWTGQELGRERGKSVGLDCIYSNARVLTAMGELRPWIEVGCCFVD